GPGIHDLSGRPAWLPDRKVLRLGEYTGRMLNPLGAAFLKGLLTSSFVGLSADRRLGLLPSCTGEGHLDGVGDRGAQAAGGGCPGRERARGAEPGTRV